jgi:hypothetical protein
MNITGGNKNQVKNIRAMLKNSQIHQNNSSNSLRNSNSLSHKNQFQDYKYIDPNISCEKANISSNEHEISFNITPDEEDIRKDVGRLSERADKEYLSNSDVYEKNNKNEIIICNYGNNNLYTFDNKNSDNEDENNYSIMLEKENFYVQKEAKELIEKTRKMMETIEANKMSVYEDFNYDNAIINNSNLHSNTNQKISNHFQHNNNNEYYPEEKPFESLKIVKMEKDENSSLKSKSSLLIN